MMLLGRFTRFLRLFRYKNLLKRYVDGISRKLEEIGFLRLSAAVIAVNILVTLSLTIFTSFNVVDSTIWVWANFLKFNYETSNDGLIVLSVIIKIFGLIYYGIVIKELMTIGRSKYEKYREKKKKEDKIKKKQIN